MTGPTLGPVPRVVHPAPLPEHLRRLERTLVMGVVNVTPDSFSDGGRWLDPQAGIRHGLDLLAQGADLLDVGGAAILKRVAPLIGVVVLLLVSRM